MYSISNGPEGQIAIINGQKGRYDGQVKNASVCYGRNAVDNRVKYTLSFVNNIPKAPDLKDIDKLPEDKFHARTVELENYLKGLADNLKSMPPLRFQWRYSPEKTDGIDKMALLGASYETLGAKSVKVSDATKILQDRYGADFDGKVIDVNNDGKIDVGEYATTFLAADALSSPDNKIDGVITNEGEAGAIACYNKKNYDIASKQYKAMYEDYKLDKAEKEFLSDENNMVK